MTKEELINKIRNNRSFDLRASEFYEPWDISDETIKDMADDFYYLLKDVLDYLAGKEEPVSEDLEKVVKDYRDKYWYPDDIDKFMGFANHIAQWQKQKDESYTKSMYKVGINTGKELMKQQMLAKAVDIEVKVDDGGYPYIPQMELYDYDKDIPLAKEGDKYKVILIKED